MAKKILNHNDFEVPDVFKYLKLMNSIDGMKCRASSMEDFLDIDLVMEAFQVQTCFRLRRVIR